MRFSTVNKPSQRTYQSPRVRKTLNQHEEAGKRASDKSVPGNGQVRDVELGGEVWVGEAERLKEEGPWLWLDSGVGLRGECQKRRAIWFGEWMVAFLKREFNTKFEKFVKQRKKAVENIRERDLKIREICGELKLVPKENRIFHNFLER